MTTSLLRNKDPLVLRATNLVEALHRAADAECWLRFVERRGEPLVLTYGEILKRATGIASLLRDDGLEQGESVVIMLSTGPTWVCTYYGILIAGGVPVPVGPTFSIGGLDKHVRTLSHIVEACRAGFFVGTARVEPYMEKIVPEGHCLKGFLRPERLDAAEPTGPGFQPPDDDALGLIQFTSGTTSMPKGVELTQRALCANCDGITEGMGVTPEDEGLSWLPLFHDMGLIGALLGSAYAPYPLTLMTPELFLMQPQRWMKVASEHGSTITVAPNFGYKTASRKTKDDLLATLDLSRLRLCLSGAEEVLAATVREFSDRFAPTGFREEAFFPVYGMAENCLAATFPPLGEHWSALTLDRNVLDGEHRALPVETAGPATREVVAVGAPVRGQAVRIADAELATLPEGAVGEVLVQSPSLMKGYHRRPDATAETLRDGWLRTGDLGFVLDSRLYITGRSKEMLIVRGRNYYPQDIEEIVGEITPEASGGSAAFGVFDAEAGTEQLVILVEADRAMVQQREELVKRIQNACIASFGIGSDQVILVKNRTLPRTTSGKLQRTRSRELYLTGELFTV